ncbi:uncharacterized protein DNG_06617 [Cephalotrichum gorgonifer]|uniref:CENP-C homolog n=1 Tax=Cephalotrichum gorgonifer TaxID=2041049 RepID=A0AAE8N1W7_9PEZI|nr:uncharacterized protein DNG_06617 [Cephalotrichum gorgonifer]
MPPRGAHRAPDRIYELGEQGRKTGVTLPDTGARDEHGLQPLEGLFSSPRKAATPRADETGELDMELESPGPGPSTVLAAQRGPRLPIPRGRSPAKTNLQSPALKNRHLGLTSSPSRGSIVRSRDTDDSDDHTVTRKLDLRKTQLNGTRGGKKTNGTRPAPSRFAIEEEEQEDSSDDSVLGVDTAPPNMDDSMQLVQDSPPPAGTGANESSEEEEVQEEAQEVARPKPGRGRPRGRPPKKAPPVQREPSEQPQEDVSEVDEAELEPEAADVPVAPVRRGRPPKQAPKATPKGSKRRERATPEEEGNQEPDRDKKRQKTQPKAKAKGKAPVAATKKSGPKPRAQPQTEDPDASILQVQPGPPLPRSRGLVSLRRDAGIQQTRSGRHSYKPLEYWKGEHVTYDQDDAREDMFRAGSRMVLPSIREVLRVEEVEEQTRKRNPRPRGRGKGPKRRAIADEEEEEKEEPEEWERETGEVFGDVVLWEAEHELNPPADGDHVGVAEDRLALSNEGTVTRDIRNATFRFAKTMNLSFMGSGVVDLAPDAEKKPKNSRKMQMVFFVFYGKVLVTVNESEFRISAGGQFFVPRGNYYSIKNDYDRPARLFFAQACEVASVLVEPGEEE